MTMLRPVIGVIGEIRHLEINKNVKQNLNRFNKSLYI